MGKGWYIVQTYAGYEQRIVDTINKLRRRDEDFAKVCTGVDLPVEEATVKNEKNEVKTVYNKILPGYILVELDFSEGDWKPSYSKVVGINGCPMNTPTVDDRPSRHCPLRSTRE